MENNPNILKAPELKYDPQGGLGYEFFRLMKLYKNKVAQYIVETDEKDSYGSLLRRCVRTAITLKSQNISKNDIVCLCSSNNSNSCVPFIASAFLGIKVASLDPSLSVQDTAYLIKLVKPKILFVSPEAVTLIEQSVAKSGVKSRLVVFGNSHKHQNFKEYLQPSDKENKFKPENVPLEEPAVIFFSSGTTGLPKGICLSNYAILGQGKNLIDNGYVTSVLLSYATLYWISAALLISSAVLSGTSRVICTKFDPHQTWTLIDKYKISFMFIAPIQAIELLRSGRPDHIDTSSLLSLLTGGGTFPEKQLVLLRDLLPGTFICQAYGQTELAGGLTFFKVNDVKDARRLHYKPSSCGRPIDGLWYKVVDPETEEIVGANKQGELRIKSKLVMTGYYNLDSSEAFDADGWLKTGDIVYYDEEQCFYVIDRLKEMLKYKSWHIAPTMLENIINSHPSVKKSVVIGIPHEEDGDHPMAVVILNNPNDPIKGQDIEDFVAGQVQDRQRLRAGVKFVKTVPMTPSGKVKRRQLRDMVLAGKI